MNRYESNLKASSPVIDDIRNEFRKMPRGVHDLTSHAIFDASEGWIIPFDYYELVPNSQLYLTYDISLLSHNPTFRRLLSGASIEVRVYKRNKNDSWEHWNNFITRGRDGKDSSTIPKLKLNLNSYSSGTDYYFTSTFAPHSPLCYLGLCPPRYFGEHDTYNSVPSSSFVKSSYPQHYATFANAPAADRLTSMVGALVPDDDADSNALGISALPFVMLESINKEFVNWNILQSNSDLIKANENHQDILPYSVTGGFVTTSDYDAPTETLNTNDINATANALVYSTSQYATGRKSLSYLNVLRRADKRGDYFDTGSPFPDLLRGDVPTLDVREVYPHFSKLQDILAEISIQVEQPS